MPRHLLDAVVVVQKAAVVLNNKAERAPRSNVPATVGRDGNISLAEVAEFRSGCPIGDMVPHGAYSDKKIHLKEGKVNVKTILLATIILVSLATAALADLDLPVDNGVITSGVGWRVDPFGSGKLAFHRGIDIAVPVGTPVRAIRSGRVIFAGDHRGHGSTVIVEHANGDRTLYGHNSLVRVHPGDLVESGTIVAFSGNTGRSTGPHVHFERLPSGRPVMELVETEETNIPQLVNNDDQRDMLEQRMEESVNSILRTINRFSSAGQGG